MIKKYLKRIKFLGINNSRMLLVTLVVIASSAFTLNLNGQTNSDQVRDYSYNSYGITGLVTTPSARMQDDGELAFGMSFEDPFNRLYGRIQLFPWLETVVRYTEGSYKAYNPGSAQTWKDKGIDAKIRLLKENDNLPAIAIGLSDFGGTGAYSSEYIVANKSYGSFDLTLGMGWGSLGERGHFSNPLGFISETFKTRGGQAGAGGIFGGALGIDRLFSGEKAALFGGVEYFSSSYPGLTIKAEYDSSKYSDAVGACYNIFDCSKKGDVTLDSPLNFSLNYGFKIGYRDNLNFSLGYVRGNTIFASFALHSNLNDFGRKKINMGTEILKEQTLKPFKELSDGWKKYLRELIIYQMARSGFTVHKIIFDQEELIVQMSQAAYPNPINAMDLASRIVANNSPKNIELITIVNFDSGIESLRTTIPIRDIQKTVPIRPLNENDFSINSFNDLSPGALAFDNESLYPDLTWWLQPNMTGTLQHQEKFYFWQLEALLNANLAISNGSYLKGSYGFKIKNNFDEYKYHIPDGQLHHVRQDRRLYLTEGESGLRYLFFDYLTNINSNVKARLAAGYIEWMYGGIGGEILYTPDSQHWSIGLDIYRVKQRDFNQRFGFQNYETTTGFLTFYYNIPFADLRLIASYGKFLGQDVGYDLEISRRFDTGARVGAKFAQTDCDAFCTGEGSFSKWVYFELPLDLFWVNSSRRGYTGYAWSPLTKDSGQKLSIGTIHQLSSGIGQDVEKIRRKPWSVKKIFSGFGTKKIERPI
ncbi:MAG: YjbH domain-containing protein [Gammaproteobacteria bacterium]|nr:YjbH domain-containing protein [Gammaproteobacteria bacterium]